MKVLLIGATGLLGRVLQEKWRGDTVVGVGSREADIREESQVRAVFESTRPDWTVLAAAYTDVDGCEREPQLAHGVNCHGAANVARAARDARSKLLFVSTDYVFDGSKAAPYEPDDPVSPINVYGESKAAAEKTVREILPDSCILRTSWLFGANGKCFPNTILAAAETQKNLRVVSDQIGCPTFNRDLAETIIQLVHAQARGTHQAVNSGPCSWFEFASTILRHAGLSDVSIESVSSEEFPRPARRPKYSVLSTASLLQFGLRMRDWRDTLANYFEDRRATCREQQTYPNAAAVEVAHAKSREVR